MKTNEKQPKEVKNKYYFYCANDDKHMPIQWQTTEITGEQTRCPVCGAIGTYGRYFK